jgi:hypothetical protein
MFLLCRIILFISNGDANQWPLSYCITITASIALYLVLRRENQRRDGQVVNEEEREKISFQDLTDKQNPYFRYVL